MKKGYMQLPHNVHETMIFMGIVSIISVNIITPLISMFETSFSWHNYLMTLSIIPFMWMAVIIIVLLAQKPAIVLKNQFVDKHDSFGAQITVNILCNVIIISVIMTIIGTWIGQRQISFAPFYTYFNNWPRNFGIAFAVEALIAQPIARKVLLFKHIHLAN
ncbi:hypothetical protein DM473_02170 [Lactobacillus helveticus]|nr:hypothetical protein [Lactobacillus helveticus]EGF35120.1 hypothetical protein AAULH_01647 [Lactobacillus helveticus MTCC 5463]AJY60886.1 membrane protein [Lactobacillus helveticus]AUJ28266.1 hypothetical protein Lh8627_08000 [Lactobacillus helveticus]AZA21114.1 MAG: hypothetical protein DQL94_01550 [Lactobacillus helveticus]EEW67974.1 hypothetical protein HMPREF0518_1076 [Lactobacillus helveticus DSM 20075 = CGMCC 1.1877]